MADISVFLHSVKLPVMPEVAHALIRTLNDEDADVGTVRDVISKDPALTATLLRMANSARVSRSISSRPISRSMPIRSISPPRFTTRSIAPRRRGRFKAILPKSAG